MKVNYLYKMRSLFSFMFKGVQLGSWGIMTVYFGGSVFMPYFSLRSFNCSSFFFVSIFWKACKRRRKRKLRFAHLLQPQQISLLSSRRKSRGQKPVYTSWVNSNIPCLHCSTKQPGIGCKRWIRKGGHRHF